MLTRVSRPVLVATLFCAACVLGLTKEPRPFLHDDATLECRIDEHAPNVACKATKASATNLKHKARKEPPTASNNARHPSPLFRTARYSTLWHQPLLASPDHVSPPRETTDAESASAHAYRRWTSLPRAPHFGHLSS